MNFLSQIEEAKSHVPGASHLYIYPADARANGICQGQRLLGLIVHADPYCPPGQAFVFRAPLYGPNPAGSSKPEGNHPMHQ